MNFIGFDLETKLFRASQTSATFSSPFPNFESVCFFSHTNYLFLPLNIVIDHMHQGIGHHVLKHPESLREEAKNVLKVINKNGTISEGINLKTVTGICPTCTSGLLDILLDSHNFQ